MVPAAPRPVQEVLAGRIGRTVDWIPVIKSLADALDVSLGDVIAEPSLVDWTAATGPRTVPALRDALMDYRQITSLFGGHERSEPLPLDQLGRNVAEVWDAYQAARFGLVTRELPALLADAHLATREYTGTRRAQAFGLLALTYQSAAMAPVLRTLLAADARPEGELLSVYSTLFLTGAMAAARAEDRHRPRLPHRSRHRRRPARRRRHHMWTSFGSTNVAIHRVATAAGLGDMQIAADLGPRVHTAALPTERRVRHALEVARALSARNKRDQALPTLLDAERLGPEQVRYHFLSCQLVLTWIRTQKGKPPYILADLARRLRVA